ncbi:SRPBCC domain-containing protein [uncultured Kordia sp.]|uniref:SRPBCC family protein n=1 Tax=uncultured Kordia sp. TaxID=507699 RepID=UPI00260A96D2|nr:SRPBCC domain-containing protein [uncultured Kordia sp.]
MKDAIQKETIFQHPIDVVWNAITTAEELSTWFIKTNFKAEKGFQYTFFPVEEKGCEAITGEIKSANPYTLVYTWEVADTNVETLVSWTLEKVAEGTKLYLKHSGISNYTGETAIAMFESFNGGWDNCITNLEAHLKEHIHAR